MMTGLLEIEERILETVETTTGNKRFIRRILTNQYDEATISHAVLDAYIETLVSKGYLEQRSDDPRSYQLTEDGEIALDPTPTTDQTIPV